MITRPIPRIGRRRPRRLLLPAAGIALIAILAAAFILAPPLFTPSKSSSKSLADYLASWQAGPVKISVPHYEVIEEKANKTPGNRGVVLTRISIQNLTAQPLDLSEAYTRLVLVVADGFGNGSHVPVDSRPVAAIPARMHLYSVGFGTGKWQVLDGTKRYRTAGWAGVPIPPGGTFTSSSPGGNSAIYVTTPPSGPVVSAAVARHRPGQAEHPRCRMDRPERESPAFCPVSSWKGENSATSFLSS